MNAFNKVIEIFIAVILLFLCPIQFFAEKQQIVIGQKVIAETSYFADAIRNTGKLTKQMYEQFLNQLTMTGNLYDIEILHYHTVYYDIANSIEGEQQDFLGSKRYYLYTTKDITDALYGDEERYTFSQGDYIRIRLTQENRSLVERIQSSLYRITVKESNTVIYGGLIRNETY